MLLESRHWKSLTGQQLNSTWFKVKSPYQWIRIPWCYTCVLAAILWMIWCHGLRTYSTKNLVSRSLSSIPSLPFHIASMQYAPPVCALSPSLLMRSWWGIEHHHCPSPCSSQFMHGQLQALSRPASAKLSVQCLCLLSTHVQKKMKDLELWIRALTRSSRSYQWQLTDTV